MAVTSGPVPETAPVAADRVVPGPVVVRRRCRVPGSVLADLGSDRVWGAAAAWAYAEDAVQRTGTRLADQVGESVPTVRQEERRDLLRVRRAAFNSRPLPAGSGAALGGPAAALAKEYTRALAARDASRHELGLALADLARTSGATVDALLRDPHLARSVELSVPGLLAAGPVGALDPAAAKKTRRRALTLLRLMQRAASKPTPFAGFATTRVLFSGAAPDAPDLPSRSHVRIDRAVIEWVRQWIAAGGYQSLRPERLWLTANPTATVHEDASGTRVTWLLSRADGTERVLSAPCGAALAGTLARLQKPVRLDTVAPGGTLPDGLARLVARGLLETGPRLPSHGRRTLHAAADATAPAPAPDLELDLDLDLDLELDLDLDATEARQARQAHQLHHALGVLRDAEDALAADPAHAGARRDAKDGIAAVATALGIGVRAGGGDRSAVGEDVVGVRAHDDGVLRADGTGRFGPEVLADLGRVQRVVPLLGFELPFQLATALAFRRRFGTDPVPVLTAYAWFLDEGRRESDALLADCQAEELATVLALRRRLFHGLRAAADRNPGAAEAACDPGLLDAVAADLPDAVMELSCAAWPVQLAGDRVVVNGVGTGYGRFAARVAAGLDPARLAVLRDWAATAATPHEHGVPVDIAASLGATVNERPLLLPAALGYPGRALECAPEAPGARVDLSSCVVRVAGGRLLLFGGEGDGAPGPDAGPGTGTRPGPGTGRFAGRPLFPVPHNATLPTVAPGLYRWLSRLGPGSGATLALWDHVDALAAPRDPEAVRHYPRLTLGRLVLSRRTWKVPAAALPAEALPGAAGAGGTAREALAWYRWCARTGVPRRSFLRGTTLPDPWDVVRGLADRRPVDAARSTSGGAALRKPLYVDFSQPLCWPALAPAPGDTLTFTEPLPDPAGGTTAAAPGSRVTEYVLETSQPPRARATEGCAAATRP
ncbi:lantibiotic dehydratase [Streptomyces laurentii]|uniref:lantibiotic dehydratase n=1 Tax=Streptomyces laurentii TaxID=39478 RepID=UPI00369CFA95